MATHPPRAGRTCEICGDTYTATCPPQRTCGRACGSVLRRRATATLREPKRPVESHHGTATGYQYGCRCDPCRNARREAAKASSAQSGRTRTCKVCGRGYLHAKGSGTGSRYCASCRPERRPKDAPPLSCRVCGLVRPEGMNWRRYCSVACHYRWQSSRHMDLYAAAQALGIRGTGYLRLLAQYLRERDGDKCGICGRQVRFDLKSGPMGDPSGLGPSIDHVVPRSKGGGDDPANLRLTHWRCNMLRRTGRKGEAVQLALLG